jgi:hypothetical protein
MIPFPSEDGKWEAAHYVLPHLDICLVPVALSWENRRWGVSVGWERRWGQRRFKPVVLECPSLAHGRAVRGACAASPRVSVEGGCLLAPSDTPALGFTSVAAFLVAFFFCSTGIWTQGIHLEPLHQPFFVMSFSKIRFCELFAQAGFRWPVLRSILSLLYQLQSHLLCSWTRSVSNKRQTCYYSHAAVASFHGSLALFWGS